MHSRTKDDVAISDCCDVYAVLVEPLEEPAGRCAVDASAICTSMTPPATARGSRRLRGPSRRRTPYNSGCAAPALRGSTGEASSRTPSTREGGNRGRGAGPTRTNKSHGAMLRTAVPTFASSWAWRIVGRRATLGTGVKALAAARSKQALASRIARLSRSRTSCGSTAVARNRNHDPGAA